MSHMEAGRELDAMIRDTFFPWDESRCRRCGWPLHSDASGCLPDNCADRSRSRTVDAYEPAPYSTDIAAAWTVFEKFGRERGWFINQAKDGTWAVVVLRERGSLGFAAPSRIEFDVVETGTTAPHAICLAALGLCNSRASANDQRET